VILNNKNAHHYDGQIIVLIILHGNNKGHIRQVQE